MIASKDYRLTNEVINVYKQIFWEASTLLQTMDVKNYLFDQKLHRNSLCDV